MCLNSGGMTTDNFFSKNFLEGGNDRGYYGKYSIEKNIFTKYLIDYHILFFY